MEIIPVKKEDHELVIMEIPDEKIEEIIEIGNDVSLWAKVTDNGFVINDKILPELTGVICGLNPHLVKWDGKIPHKIPNVVSDEEIPEGYERRCDIKLSIEDQLVGVSLAKSSLKYQLAKYLKHLKNDGLKPDHVVTCLKVKQASNQFGVFNIVTFSMVGSVDQPQRIPTKTVENDIENDNVSSAEPSSASELPQEWDNQ